MPERVFHIDTPETSPTVLHVLGELVPLKVLGQWREVAQTHVATGNYLSLLTPADAIRYPFADDAWAAAVVNTAEYAEVLESGHAGFHLPERWGGEWYVSKAGRRYRFIPFRHNVPLQRGGGATTLRGRRVMPKDIYAAARQLPNRGRLTELGDYGKQSKSYRYYQQAHEAFPEDLVTRALEQEGQPGYTWRASPWEGMRRTVAPTPGGGHHNQYMTWRTITADSVGWYIPPHSGYGFAQRALDGAAPEIQQLLDEAAATDIAAQAAATVEDL